MNHKHVGRDDEACEGCFDEAQAQFRKSERLKTVAGVLLLVVLALVFAGVVSYYLGKHIS